MSPRTYLATTARVLTQLGHDRRTIGLIMVVPSALVTLLYLVYLDSPLGEVLFDSLAVSMIAILPMAVMFLVTSVTMLRERASGTLERLWTTPLHRADLLLGYATAFTVVAVGQSLILCVVAARFLDVEIAASWAWVVLTALVDAFLGVALGLFGLRPYRVPGRPVHASGRRPADLPVRPARRPRPDAPRPGAVQQRPAHELGR